MSDSQNPIEIAHKPSTPEDDRKLRHTAIAMLTTPAVMCLLIGVGYALIDWQSGAFLIAVGVGLGAVNAFVYKMLLRKMAEAQDAPPRDEEEDER